jgi:tetratricopeptide (TPR) repeat protein
MRTLWLFIPLLACATTGRLAAQASLPPELQGARLAIAAGRIDDAVHLALRYTSHHPRDAQGFLVLGDAYFKRMPVGRFQALRAYEQAERVAPDDPRPPYAYAQVGLWLGGDDGEAEAKKGLERVLELEPRYQDAWDEWLTLLRNSGSRRRMRERLDAFANDPVVRGRIALLDIEEERYPAADSLLDVALAADSTNAAWLALRAQSAFEAGDTLGGWAFYRRALAHADLDSTDALWHQVVGIAWPSEIRAWAAGVPPARKRGWLEAFWARRNPDLFAGVNHRVAEHFARLRYARKNYPLLHPLISYHRSQVGRAMSLEPSAGERAYNLLCEEYEVLVPSHPTIPHVDRMALAGANLPHSNDPGVPMPGVSRASDRARVSLYPFAAAESIMEGRSLGPGVEASTFVSLNLNLLSVDSVAARIGYNLATGLDDRGVMYLRFGAPDEEYVGGKNTADPRCNSPDVERWNYAEYGEVRFARPSAFSHGLRTVPDMVFRAMNERQFEAVQTGLTRDASSEPAPLDFGVWTAQFADSVDVSRTDVVVVSTRGSAAASLVGMLSPGTAHSAAEGIVTLDARPGRYVLLAQAEDSGRLGRQTLSIEVKRFDSGPVISELLLAPAWTAPITDRAAMLERVERALVFPQGSAIRSYAEVYGLRPTAGLVRFRVQYELLKTGSPERDIRLENWPDAIRLEFVRERPAGVPAVPEVLDITPDRVPPGRYLLRVRVRDLVAGADAGRATIAFAVR